MKVIVFYFICVSVLATAISHYYNPYRNIWWEDSKIIKPIETKAIVFEQPEISRAQSSFRVNKLRQGNYQARSPQPGAASLYPLPLKDEGEFSLSQNLGIHSASKASLAIDKDGIFWGRDTAWGSYFNQSGKVLWEFANYTAAYGIHGSAFTDENSIYIGDYSGLLSKFSKQTGNIQWMLPLGDALGATPILDDDGFIYANIETSAPNGYIAKINSKTAEVVWRSSWLGEQSHSSPALCDDDTLFFGANNGIFYALSKQTGKTKWSYVVGGAVKSTPACSGNLVIFSGWDKRLHALDIRTGTPVWDQNIAHDNMSSVALSLDHKWAYINSDRGLCRIEAQTGKNFKCTREKFNRASRKASPIVIQETVSAKPYVWTACTPKQVCAYDGETLERLKSWDLPASVSGELKFYDGKIWFVTNGSPEVFVIY